LRDYTNGPRPLQPDDAPGHIHDNVAFLLAR
jgi:hypothetical protein